MRSERYRCIFVLTIREKIGKCYDLISNNNKKNNYDDDDDDDDNNNIQRIRGYFYNEMRYINLRFTYLLTYLLKLRFFRFISRNIGTRWGAAAEITATDKTAMYTHLST